MTLTAIEGIPLIAPGDDLAALIFAAASRQALGFGPGDIVAVCQKIVSKSEGRTRELAEIQPSALAHNFAAQFDKDARAVELVLREARRIIRMERGVLIVETGPGWVCANAGMDESNSMADGRAILLPLDPDASAERIRAALGAGRAVIISDTFGRPWREGLVDVAIGVAGLAPLRSYIGETDRAGRELQVTVMARADQIAAAAGILMEKDAGVPAVWVEGIEISGKGSLRDLLRDPARDLFR